MIRDLAGPDEPVRSRVPCGVWRARAIFVRRHLSYYFSPNYAPHGEALGLVHAASCFRLPAKRPTGGPSACACSSRSAAGQVHADGVHFEQSNLLPAYSAETYLTL
jgi:hypothetical protein